jgi:flagellar L-ring protein precursor FlgH
LLGTVGWASLVASAQAQSSSLYGDPGVRPQLTLARDSWYFIPPEPVKSIQINDIVTVVVTEKAQVISTGQLQRRTQGSLDLRLRNWIQLQNFSLLPLPSSLGEDRIRGSDDAQMNTTANLNVQDAMNFRIAARVVDVRPNGTLVIEAHKTIRSNEEAFEMSLTGIVRREDVSPQNTVDSEDISELDVIKRDVGDVRDAYRRGWLLKTLDRFKPF